ncbi:ABC transporter permease [Specibacter cremeus]|uniref:ABC transporter permease n=1 Tax=Specibacter cremeus TaxID=1629051 RepID=UPI000F791A00|nr:ABC transporter permease [Specibacter cremeus]
MSVISPPTGRLEAGPATRRRTPVLAVAARTGRRLGASGTVAAALLAVLVLVAAFAPVIAPFDPTAPDLANALTGPGATHWLGTDALGRDTLSRLIVGSRITLVGPILVIAVSTAAGTALALLAAYAGGRVDMVVSRVLDVLFAVPGIVFALVTVAIAGPGLPGVVIGLSIAYTPYVARVVRSAALRERALPYIDAAWVTGRSGLSICLRHLLPNLAPMIMAQAVSALGLAVVDIAAISFLGLGVQPPATDWGLMVKSGIDTALRGYPTEALAAAVLIAAFVAAITVVSDRLTEQAGELR